MKKQTILKLLAIMIGVIIIAASLTTGLSVFAADPAEAGTEEKGMPNQTGGESGVGRAVTSLYLQNGDFEKGLMYWTTTAQLNGATPPLYADETGSIITEGNNKYFTFDGESRNSYAGIKTGCFVIPKSEHLAVGDQVAVVYDHLGDATNMQVKIDQIKVVSGQAGYANANTNAGYKLKDPTVSSPWATYITYAKNSGSVVLRPLAASSVTADDALGIKAGDFMFQITVAVVSNKSCTDSIDNLRVVKVKDGKYYDPVTGEEITFPPIADEENLAYGSEAEGFKQTAVNNLKPLDKALNLDFQQGLRYWAGKANNTFATENVELKTEGTNKFLKIKGDKQWRGFTSHVIKLSNVQVGDKVTVFYDWKGAATSAQFQFYLEQWDLKSPYTSGGSLLSPRLTNGFANQGKKVDLASTPAGWTTYVQATNAVLKAPVNGDNNLYVRLCFEACVAEEIDLYLDNLKIAKVSADGKVYTDVVTNQVIYDANAPTTTPGGSTTGGSTTGGSTTRPNTGTGTSAGTSTTTGDSILMLAALFFVSGAGVFGTAKALKSR